MKRALRRIDPSLATGRVAELSYVSSKAVRKWSGRA
jgi:hypothetical protein